MDFSTVAHDLRSPLHVMLGQMQLLAGEHLSDTGRQRLGILEAQVRRMMRLLEGLSDQAIRPERPGTVDMGALIDNLVFEFAPVLEANGIEIKADIESDLPIVRGDTDSLYRVLLNIVTNAAESIAGAGAIVVGARMEQRLAGVPAIHVCVADTGRASRRLCSSTCSNAASPRNRPTRRGDWASTSAARLSRCTLATCISPACPAPARRCICSCLRTRTETRWQIGRQIATICRLTPLFSPLARHWHVSCCP